MPTFALLKNDWITLVYLLAAVLFIYGLKMLSKVNTARRGNMISALGMLIAAAITLYEVTGATMHSLIWIGVALLIGATIGLIFALRVPMTGMPQMVALLNGFGGIASLLVACGWYATHGAESYDLSVGLAVLIGGVTFTGSLIAFAKLQGGAFKKWVPGTPVQLPLHKLWIALLILAPLALSGIMLEQPGWGWMLLLIALLSLAAGVPLVVGIGGADMPVVISLLNSYSGLAAAMAGFVLNNYALIITGSLVGASGLILTSIMCKAMNRSLVNVLFGGVGFEAAAAGATTGSNAEGKTARESSIEDAAIVLDAAQSVIVVPGYGMAVAQAQHAVRELADELARRSIAVKYAIHPVAGRMPGHMNVLLAEANVPYEQLYDLDGINPEFEQADVALVIGANDVTNPAARHAKSSPIYGMPILNVDKARQIFVIKRSLNPGFAGIENELYYDPKCAMLFGDAKKVVADLTAELKAEA